MALLDAYATTAEYIAITAQKATADSALSGQIAGMSRLLEKSLQVAPGAFNSATGTRVFDGSGEATLVLRDRYGLAYFLQTIDADSLKVDSDLDGSYDDYTLDLADAWVRGLPENAAAASEPFREIELRALSSATLTTFPKLPGCIQITGTWGWSAVPDVIKQLVVHRTNELRQALAAGALQEVSSFEGALPMRPYTNWLFREAERLYGRRTVAFA